MRDLKKHPITAEEMVTTLEQMQGEAMAEELPGDIRPEVLRLAVLAVKTTTVLTQELIDEGIVTKEDIEELAGRMGSLS